MNPDDKSTPVQVTVRSLEEPTIDDVWSTAMAKYIGEDRFKFTDRERGILLASTASNAIAHVKDLSTTYEQDSRIASKLVSFVEGIKSFAAAVDVIANVNPMPMSLIWGLFRVVMQVVSDYGEYLSKVATMFMQIGDILPRYELYLSLFPQRIVLRTAMEKVFEEIIRFCLDTWSLFRPKGGGGLKNSSWFTTQRLIMKSAWKPFKKDFEDVLERFRNHKKLVEREAMVSEMVESGRFRKVARKHFDEQESENKNAVLFRKELREHHEDASRDRSETRAFRAEERAKENALQQKTIIDWLTPTDFTLKQNDLIRRRHPDTGTWLLNSPEFQSWISPESEHDTLFCPGIPGAGKTMLASIVIDDLIERFDKGVGIAYIYFNFQSEEEQTVENLLCCILKQLCRRIQGSLPECLVDLYERDSRWNERSRPPMREIMKVIEPIFLLFPRIFLVVDALDECQDADGSECRSRFLSEIFKLQEKFDVKLFATSRIIQEIVDEFHDAQKVEIRAIDEDVRNYLHGRITESGSSAMKSHREEIVSEIATKVDGMFLLAQLHLEAIRKKRTLRQIRDVLKGLVTQGSGSRAYDQAYESAMERIIAQDPDSVELAKKVLSWITCAKLPLTTSELCHALAVEADSGDTVLDETNIPEIQGILSVCSGLVIVDEQSQIIRLVHYTAQEYFERERNRWFPDAAVYIVRTCIAYLSFDTFWSVPSSHEEFQARKRDNPFYNYAAYSWGQHARELPVLPPEVLNFLRQCTTQVEGSGQCLFTNFSTPERMLRQTKGLHLAAAFGLVQAVDVLANESDVNLADRFRRTPLFYAAGRGHAAVVELLLRRGACLGERDIHDNTALSIAAENGHEENIKLLLAGGADPRSRDRHGQTPLSWAAEMGSTAIIKIILEHGAEVDSSDVFGNTPLSWCAENGHVDGADLLLRFGADPQMRVENDQTCLHLASWRGHECVVALLLQHGADPNIQDKFHQTPLLLAAQRDREQVGIVGLLLEHGANVLMRDGYGQTPAFLAAAKGHTGILRLLLEKDPECPQQTEAMGRTPLFHAAQGGCIEILAMLLESAMVHWWHPARADIYGMTPLSIAAAHGHIDIVRILLSTSAFPLDHRDFFGRTPLWFARRSGDEDVVNLLLESGASPELDNILQPHSAPGESFADCDVCTLQLPENEIFYACSECNGGDFDICAQCYAVGARCIAGELHDLKRKMKRSDINTIVEVADSGGHTVTWEPSPVFVPWEEDALSTRGRQIGIQGGYY